MSAKLTRRRFLDSAVRTTAAFGTAAALASCSTFESICAKGGLKICFGLVTYLWGQDWDLPTLINNCERTGVLGVELRTEHAHGVEADLTAQQRRDVKKCFDDSAVTLLGPGTNFEFHSANTAELQKNIEGAKRYVKLSNDVGGSGVKVKPNTLPDGVPVEKTIEQIGTSLNELGRFAANFNQEIRVEVHGEKTQQLGVIKQIMDIADHPNVAVCWNCNPQDLDGRGLEYNFQLVKNRFGNTAHVRELNIGDYPYQQLMNLFVKMDYAGWILLEARTKPADRVRALIEQRLLFEEMLAKARATV